ncbi:MAG: AI-2E family transporter [Candidatus Ancillula sp.]|nr:AI-2E family transporter [Candidatus Ancillula sp.]
MNEKLNLSRIFTSGSEKAEISKLINIILIRIALFIFGGIFVLYAINQLSSIISVIVIAYFFGVALEPLVNFLASKGVNKSIGAALCIFTILATIVIIVVLFGNLLVSQLIALLNNIPDSYVALQKFIHQEFGFELPTGSEITGQLFTKYANEIGSQALGAGVSLFATMINAITAIMLIYYLSSQGDRFRNLIVRHFSTSKQLKIREIMSIISVKIAGFLGSRLILALISAIATSIFLKIMDIPFYLPLGLFVAVISQFIPTIGAYIGGALPVIVSLSNKGIVVTMIVLAFLVIYQQIENFVFLPKVSAETLQLNPAITFLAVLSFGYLFGPLGAFLALPITATISTLLKMYLKTYKIAPEILQEVNS